MIACKRQGQTKETLATWKQITGGGCGGKKYAQEEEEKGDDFQLQITSATYQSKINQDGKDESRS